MTRLGRATPGTGAAPGLATDIAIAFLAFAVVSLVSASVQPRLSVNEGKGFDGVYYYAAAEQFARGGLPHTDAPFVYRIGTPWLVSVFFPQDPLHGFFRVNLVANAVATILLALWLRLYVSSTVVRAALVLAFATQWHGPVRRVFFSPITPDPWFIAILLAALIAARAWWVKPDLGGAVVVGSLVFTGTLFRETMLLVPIALACGAMSLPTPLPAGAWQHPFALLRRINRPPAVVWIPALYGALAWLLTRLVASPTNQYSFFQTAVGWATDKSPLVYAHGWFVAYGVMLAPVVYHWRDTWRFLIGHQTLLALLVGFSVGGWVGGSDTQRLLYWSMPIVLVLVGRAVEASVTLWRPALLALLIVAQLVSQRVFWTTPDPRLQAETPFPILTPPTSHLRYRDLSSWFGNQRIQMISLAQYLAVCGLMLGWMSRNDSRADSQGYVVRPTDGRDT